MLVSIKLLSLSARGLFKEWSDSPSLRALREHRSTVGPRRAQRTIWPLGSLALAYQSLAPLQCVLL